MGKCLVIASIAIARTMHIAGWNVIVCDSVVVDIDKFDNTIGTWSLKKEHQDRLRLYYAIFCKQCPFS